MCKRILLFLLLLSGVLFIGLTTAQTALPAELWGSLESGYDVVEGGFYTATGVDLYFWRLRLGYYSRIRWCSIQNMGLAPQFNQQYVELGYSIAKPIAVGIRHECIYKHEPYERQWEFTQVYVKIRWGMQIR